MRALFIITIFATLWSCGKPIDDKSAVEPASNMLVTSSTSPTIDSLALGDVDYDSFFKIENYMASGVENDSIFELVNMDCAILIYPTVEQIEEMKKTDGEENFYIAADDANWYQAQVIDTLDHVGIKTIVASEQFLRLKGQERTWDLDIRKKNMPAWNVIFFKITKEPQIISTTDLTVDEVKAYFDIGD